MTQRQLNQWVARLRERAGPGDLGRDRILSACHRTMRELRGLPRVESHHAFELNGEVDDAAAKMLSADDALGRIYQALNAPALASAYRATAREGRKFRPDEIPAVTQLFTPRWVVEFLLHNTLGRLWREWHPDSTIAWRWLIDRPTEPREPFRPLSTLRILDPACGTMNFGLVAGEMLTAMYREEMTRAGRPGWPSEPSVREEREIARRILSSNLIGLDIDPVALELAGASLRMKFGDGRSRVQLVQADALFDPVVGDADIVVTNPPYLSARNIDPARVKQLKRRFPGAWRDEYACFIHRCSELTRERGRFGLLTMHSFMFTAGFEGLRTKLAESAALETIAHFGPSLFDVGNPGTLQTVAFTARKGADPSAIAVFVRLTDGDAKHKEEALYRSVRDGSGQFRLSQTQLTALPRGAWAYWMSPVARTLWRTMPTLGRSAPPRQGLATTNNARFVRYWWEVEGQSPLKWRPYAKGGENRRWYQNPLHRVNWANDGAEIKRSIIERYPYLNGKWEWVAKNSEYYGREGITYSYLTSGRFSARWMPEGTLFDVAGSAIFPDDPLTLLAILNSSAARELLHAINPTVNFQVGDLAQLPIPPVADGRLQALVREAMDLQKQLDEFDETSVDFVSPMPWRGAPELDRSMRDSLHRIETEIEQIIAKWYGMDARVDLFGASLDIVDLARRWVSHALRSVLRNIDVLEINSENMQPVRGMLIEQCDDASAAEIEGAVGGLEAFLCTRFAGWHNQLYKRRSRVVAIRSGSRVHLVSHEKATAGRLMSIIQVPKGWDRFIDDGVLVNFAPLHDSLADAPQRRYLRLVNADLLAGKFSWSETARALTTASVEH